MLAAAGLVASYLACLRGRDGWAFALHFVGIGAAVAFIFAAMAPDVMRSLIDPAYSLTYITAASADTTLVIMLVAAVAFVPVVLFYTVWGYKVFSARVHAETIDPDEGLHPTRVRDSAQPEAHIGY